MIGENMNRRLFLKALSLSPLAPGLLCAKEKRWSLRNYPAEPVIKDEDVKGLTIAKVKKARDELMAQEANEKWFSLKLNPELENIPGAKEWIQRMEDEVYKECPNPPKIWVV